MKKYRNILIIIAVAALAGVFFSRNYEKLADVSNISAFHLVGLVFFSFITRYLIGERLRLLIKPLGSDIKRGEAFGLSIIQGYMNAIVPKGGTAALAYYFNRVKGLTLSRFFSLVGGGFVVSGIVSGTVGTIGSVVFIAGVGSTGRVEGGLIVLGGFAILLLSCLGFVTFKPRIKPDEDDDYELGMVIKIIEGWLEIRKSPRTVLWLMVVEFGALLSFTARYWIAFRAFSIDVSFLKCMLLAPIAHVSFMLNITPAGIGVRETAVGFTSALIGAEGQLAAAAAALDTAVFLAVVFITGPPVNYLLVKRSRGDSP